MTVARYWIRGRVRYFITKEGEGIYSSCIGKPSDPCCLSESHRSLEDAGRRIDEYIILAYGMDGIEHCRVTA